MQDDARNDESKDESADHTRIQSITPSEMRQMLPKQPWDCPLCTFSNKPGSQHCNVCNTPRPLLRQVMYCHFYFISFYIF